MTSPPDAVLERLTRLHPKLIDLSLGRIERLLGVLGNPERRLAPVVHVAGTNGKGSLIAYLRSCLEAAGYAVHAFTSPHLVRFNERIRIAGQVIADEALTLLLEECEAANKGLPITFFEITTATALLAFSRQSADVVLLETGLGGRLDSTNVVARPALTAITPVSVDHQRFLGHSLAGVAAEKAGIIKPGVPCVSALQEPAAAKVIAERAAGLNAPLFRQDREWGLKIEAAGFVLESAGRTRRLALPALIGAHQVHNAAHSVACLDRLEGFAVPEAAILGGLAAVEWPGRLQRLRRGPLPEILPAGWELWVDGGHNAAAAEALATQAGQWRDKPLYLVLGMMEGKDPAAFLAPFKGSAAKVLSLAIPGQENALGGGPLAAAARDLGIDGEARQGVAEALADIARTGNGPARVLITGSLYLVGTVLAENG